MSQGRNAGSGNRRNRNHHHHGNKHRTNFEDKRPKGGLELIDPNSPVLVQFKSYAAQLNDKFDRYERIVKLCRDITTESKKIIFLLHSMDNYSKKDETLKEAETRLNDLMRIHFKSIASELDGQDPYQYIKAYKGGLQEFIEAVTFCQYLKEANSIEKLPRIESWDYIENKLTYSVTTETKSEENEEQNQSPKILKALVLPSEYILGISDLTGELMRKGINDLARGDIESCWATCNFIRDMYKGFLRCGGSSTKEINRKVYTLKQSLLKIENVCYTIKIRGQEIPKHMLADVAIIKHNNYPTNDEDVDEEY